MKSVLRAHYFSLGIIICGCDRPEDNISPEEAIILAVVNAALDDLSRKGLRNYTIGIRCEHQLNARSKIFGSKLGFDVKEEKAIETSYTQFRDREANRLAGIIAIGKIVVLREGRVSVDRSIGFSAENGVAERLILEKKGTTWSVVSTQRLSVW